MSDTNKEIETKNSSDNEWSLSNPWAIISILLFAFGQNGAENPKVGKLEERVAKLEGQMSMIGGRFHE